MTVASCSTCQLRGSEPRTLAVRYCKAPPSANPIWRGTATSFPLVHWRMGAGCGAYKQVPGKILYGQGGQPITVGKEPSR